MTKFQEKVRLLLVANENKTGRVRHPKHCFLFTVAQTFFVLVFLAVLIFIAVRVVQIEEDLKGKEKQSSLNTIPGSDFCKSVNAENMSLVAMGYLTGVRKESIRMEAMNKIYYVTDRFLTDQEACSVEALLRLLQDKSVFVVEIGNFTAESNQTSTDYVKFLREQYTNLNLIKSSPIKFFKGSPFQMFMNSVDDFSIFAAKVLLVWQFGGTVLSPDLLLLNRRLFDNSEGFCKVDRQLLFCPNQCSAYVYQLVKTILDTPKSQSITQESLQSLVDKSVVDYCGDKEDVQVGCVGVQRVKPQSICRIINPRCDYLRVQDWKLKDKDWKSSIQKFCPKIVQRYMPNLKHLK